MKHHHLTPPQRPYLFTGARYSYLTPPRSVAAWRWRRRSRRLVLLGALLMLGAALVLALLAVLNR